jgi:LPXTG-motif cell wall-anchored protein
MRRPIIAIAIGLAAGVCMSSPAAALAPTPDAPTPDAPTPDAVVKVSTNCAAFCFVPAQTTIVAGGTVTWIDKSGTEHNIARCDPAHCEGVSGGTGTDAAFTAAHIPLPASGTAKFTFTQPGTYVYYCTIHGYALMHGTITVTAAATSTTSPVTAPPATAAPVSVAPIAVAPVTPPAGPQLANTGSAAGGALTLAAILVVVGLTGAGFRRRRRWS